MKTFKLISTILGAANALQVGVNDTTQRLFLLGNGDSDET